MPLLKKPLTLDELIGTTGVVLETINHVPGQSGFVKVDHERWPAYSTTPTTLLPGTPIRVLKRTGVCLTVQSLQ